MLKNTEGIICRNAGHVVVIEAGVLKCPEA